MTYRRVRLLLLLALVLGVLGAGAIARAGPATATGDLPEGVVAVVAGRQLTYDGFALAAAQHALGDLKRHRSGPRMILEELIEEVLIAHVARDLGVEVTQADVDALWKDLDGKLRRRSNGERTLRDTIKEQGTTERRFVAQLWHMLRKRRIAEHPKYLGKQIPVDEQARLVQIDIVIAGIREKANVRYGVLTVEHVEQETQPDDLGPGVVATLDMTPITMQAFGYALLDRLPPSEVREYLERECRTGLLVGAGYTLDDAQLDAEIAHLEALWPLESELQEEVIWKTVSFQDRFQNQYQTTLEDVRESRYIRGLLGLVRHLRGTLREEEVRAFYEERKDTTYGPHLLVHDIEFEFGQEGGIMANVDLRTIAEAREAARNVGLRLARGESYEALAREINNRQDPTARAHRVRLFRTPQCAPLHDVAARMRDGDVSAPFETLAEVHVMRREGQQAAQALTEVEAHVRETLARRAAHAWIIERMKDPEVVRMRWPLQ